MGPSSGGGGGGEGKLQFAAVSPIADFSSPRSVYLIVEDQSSWFGNVAIWKWITKVWLGCHPGRDEVSLWSHLSCQVSSKHSWLCLLNSSFELANQLNTLTREMETHPAQLPWLPATSAHPLIRNRILASTLTVCTVLGTWAW